MERRSFVQLTLAFVASVLSGVGLRTAGAAAGDRVSVPSARDRKALTDELSNELRAAWTMTNSLNDRERIESRAALMRIYHQINMIATAGVT